MSGTATGTVYDELVGLLGRLDASRVPYHLLSARTEVVMVQVALPGERWEIEFMPDGDIEIERFRSDGTIDDGSALPELFRRLDIQD